MDGAKPCWASLPRELHLHILEHVANAHSSPASPSRGIARYASVSKDWQDFFEGMTFKNFVLRLQDLIPFREHTQSPRRRGYVRHIWLRLEEPHPEEDDPALPWNQSRSPFATATLYLWNTLASWEVDQAGEELTLEISSHTQAGLIRYNNYTPKDDIDHYLKYLETRSLVPYDEVEPFSHTSLLWIAHMGQGQSISMHSGAIKALYSYDLRLSRIRLPSVQVVTKFLMRRANTRNLYPDSLNHIIKSLPRLKEIHFERWRLCSVGAERRWLQGCLLVEHLALCFIVDADDFLNNAPNFPELKTLTLTAEIFLGVGGNSDEAVERRMKIKTLLLLAALAACRMPKLELLEIWNGRNGQVSIFRYKVDSGLAEITWKSTQDDVVVDDDIVKAWEATARVHARDDLRSSIIRLPDGQYTYYGSVLPHLESNEHFIHEVSAAQMK
ncbi:uncharacterized protein N0V96_011121 [Colletotrichum fioriniae]|uniref:uncharacterized protein n=1 Tax=Colletotrichum fioriniae TaxID=710243 RepID=UPI0032DA5BB2|nr:hypothetical protein N0V96_011121 [Colletotrichum fioriniae]